MARYKETIQCVNKDCAHTLEVEFTDATRKVRLTCPFCRQLNQIEIILPSDRGGIADRVGLPENGAKMKIVVLPGD
jgi:predicted metal-dependent hydrolase